MKKLSVLGVIVGATVICAVPVSLRWLPAQTPSLTVDKANAVIGRPLTPGSVAGVNRRVHRRAYRRGYYGHY
jgi:hypothetical protein